MQIKKNVPLSVKAYSKEEQNIIKINTLKNNVKKGISSWPLRRKKLTKVVAPLITKDIKNIN